jgi:hypothetical protein
LAALSCRHPDKPGILRNSAAFLKLPLAFQQLKDQMLHHPGDSGEMADILVLGVHHDELVVVRAMELALDQGWQTKRMAYFSDAEFRGLFDEPIGRASPSKDT